jgi:hypothetical protein
MNRRAFRFGIVSATADTGAAWVATARRAEALGFDTLLVPDTRHTFAPFPAMAAAAASTTAMRVGSYVLTHRNAGRDRRHPAASPGRVRHLVCRRERHVRGEARAGAGTAAGSLNPLERHHVDEVLDFGEVVGVPGVDRG